MRETRKFQSFNRRSIEKKKLKINLKMKVCPKCARSFDESFSFCLEDGTMLLSSTAPGETQRISTKSAAKTEIFPAKFQNLENSIPKKQGEKNGWKTSFLIMTGVAIIGAIVPAFLFFSPPLPDNKSRNQIQPNGNERASSRQSNKNANVAALNRADNTQNSAKSGSPANVKTDSANQTSPNENAEKSSGNNVESVLPNLKQEMSYATARKVLIESGWQAATLPPNREFFGNMDYIVNTLGFYEVEDCSGTGLGFCRFLFKNSKGEKLIVVTVNNEEDSLGEPTVSSWTLK